MAKKLISASIATAQTIEAGHVSQSIKAFTGTEAYDITISGSLEITGSTDINGVLSIPGFSNVSASLATSFDGFPFTGSAGLLGTLNVNGPAGHITASGNISSSGNLEGGGLKIDGGEIFATPAIFKLQSGSGATDTFTVIRSSNDRLVVNGGSGAWNTFEVLNADLIATNITASGLISASGDITGDTVSGVTGSFSQISSYPTPASKTDIKMGSSTIEIGPSAAATLLGGSSFPFVTHAGTNNFKGLVAASNYLVGSGSAGLGGIPTTSTLRIGS